MEWCTFSIGKNIVISSRFALTWRLPFNLRFTGARSPAKTCGDKLQR